MTERTIEGLIGEGWSIFEIYQAEREGSGIREFTKDTKQPATRRTQCAPRRTAMSDRATTAKEYAERYLEAFKNDALTQGVFHTERDGRQLACALGVIGDDVNDPKDCPAQIMPRWLAQMVPAFFDKQRKEDAFAWGKDFTTALSRIDGNVPFSVIHDWHANFVYPLGIEAAEKRGRDTAPHKALQALHLRALAGEKISEDEWRPVLKDAYAYANAYANAYADAYANAYANANANAYAYAYANANANAWKRLADGMVECLNRVEVIAHD